MKRIFGVLVAAFLFTPLMGAFAASDSPVDAKEKVIHPTIIMNQLKVVKAGESNGDELYIELSVYRANKSMYYLRVPEKPMHWSSRAMNTVQLIPLWSEPLKEGESVTITVALMEADDSELNPDDTLGSMHIKLTNAQGGLQTVWSDLNRMDSPTTIHGQSGDIHRFSFVTEDGNYEFYMSVKLKP